MQLTANCKAVRPLQYRISAFSFTYLLLLHPDGSAVFTLLGRPTLVGKALSFTHKLSLFYQDTMLSSHTVDDNQMYFGASVVGKASTIGTEVPPTPPLIFTGGQKVQNLALFPTSLNFEPHAFENAAR